MPPFREDSRSEKKRVIVPRRGRNVASEKSLRKRAAWKMRGQKKRRAKSRGQDRSAAARTAAAWNSERRRVGAMERRKGTVERRARNGGAVERRTLKRALSLDARSQASLTSSEVGDKFDLAVLILFAKLIHFAT